MLQSSRTKKAILITLALLTALSVSACRKKGGGYYRTASMSSAESQTK
ncbi:MAG: hypothetical protein ABJB74_04070 [Gemmatimonas sp.]